MRGLPVPLWLSILLIPGLVVGGGNPAAKVAVHVMPHDAHRTCNSGVPEAVICLDINTTYEGCGDMDVFPVFYDVSEYLGVEYGLDWPGTESCTFTHCSDLRIGEIVWPGDGISQVWFSCQPGPTAIPGWGWIYTTEPGLVSVAPHPYAQEVHILDCLEALDQPIYRASAGVCGFPGDDPCFGASDGVLTLDVSDSVGTGCVLAGHYITYTIVYENASDIRALSNVVIKNTLPEEVKFISATAGGGYVSSTHKVVWQLGDIAPGFKDSVQIRARVLIETLPDIDIVDNCIAFEDQAAKAASAETTSICADTFAPMGLTKDDGLGGAGITAGDTIDYTIYYDNIANEAPMHSVLVRDLLATGVGFRSASHGGTYSAPDHQVFWELGTVGAGEEGCVHVVVETAFDLYYRDVITNICEIVSDEIRPVVAEKQTRVTEVLGRYAGLHVLPVNRNRSCADMASGVEVCDDIETEIEGCGFVHVFPVFVDIPDCQAVSYRLTWPDEWSDMTFTSCSDATAGNLVRPGDEISHSWFTCKSGALVITGWGEVFATGPGRVEIPYDGTGYATVTTCDGRTLGTEVPFACGVCGSPGEDPPCGGGPTNVRATTWGEIKAMFR
jgi:uncharacterized repeat protein (TIGR01451 family)